MGVGRYRIRPKDIGGPKEFRKKAREKQKELKLRIWANQKDLLDEYSKESGVPVNKIIIKLINHFFAAPSHQRDKILRRH